LCESEDNRVQKMTMIAEGAEAKRVEDAVAERKRKADEKERWEGKQSLSSFVYSRTETDRTKSLKQGVGKIE